MSAVSIIVRTLAACVVGVLVVGSCPARAAVGVGDKPELSLKTVDGKQVSSEMLKGKIVMLDFWATWCGPCVAEAPHMVKVNEKYGPKGLQIIGISLDHSPAALTSGVKQLKFTWPQYLDTGSKVAGQFGVNGIPRVFLISPDGAVLWTGHPAGMDKAIEQAFKEHPPRLVDSKTLSKAKELLTEIEQKNKAGETAAALKLLAKVPEEAKADKDLAERMETLSRAVEAEADKMLAEVDPLIEKGEYTQAVTRLKDVSRALAGTPVAAKARRKLNELLAKPDVREKVEGAEKAARADEALNAAKALQQQKKDDLAYGRFKALVREFPDTSAAATASAEIKRYEADPAFVKRVAEKETGGKARAALSMARSYRTAHKTEQARQKYQSVIREFPNTQFAQDAQRELASLGR